MATDTDGAQPVVDVNTDDLDAFNDVFVGKAKAAPAEEVKEEKIETPVVADDDATETTEADTAAEAREPEAEDGGADEEAPEGADADAEAEDEDEFKPKHKNRTTAQERISELTAARKAAERERDALAARIAALEAGQNKTREPEAPVQERPVAADPDAPHPMATDDKGELLYPLGEFDPNYVADLTRFMIRKENATLKEEQQIAEQKRQAQEAENALHTQWTGKLEKAEADFEDLRPTIASLESQLRDVPPELGTYLAQTIMQMEVGPQVLYYLANHPDEANEIVAAGPVGATLKLGKLEAKVETALAKRRGTKEEKPAAPVRQTQAPEPPVATRGVGARNGTPVDTDDLDAFSDVFFNKKRK
jgi:hypothetical protein